MDEQRPTVTMALCSALQAVVRAERYELEFELALLERGRVHKRRGRINWSVFSGLRERLSEAQNHRCCWCGKRMDESAARREDRPTFEHVVPLAEGGPDDVQNLAIACNGCNEERGRATSRRLG